MELQVSNLGSIELVMLEFLHSTATATPANERYEKRKLFKSINLQSEHPHRTRLRGIYMYRTRVLAAMVVVPIMVLQCNSRINCKCAEITEPSVGALLMMVFPLTPSQFFAALVLCRFRSTERTRRAWKLFPWSLIFLSRRGNQSFAESHRR